MEVDNKKNKTALIALFAVLLAVGTNLGRSARISEIRLVDKLQLISFGALLGVLITRYFVQKRR